MTKKYVQKTRGPTEIVTQVMPAAAVAQPRVPTILVDCDGVLADLAGLVARFLVCAPERFKQPNFSECDLNPAELLQVERIAHHPETASNVDAYPGAREMLRELETLGRVVIVTKPWESKHWYAARVEWLRSVMGIPRDRIIFTHNKADVRGDVLIEDTPAQLNAWQAANPDGLGILIARPWNAGECALADVAGAVRAHLAKEAAE